MPDDLYEEIKPRIALFNSREFEQLIKREALRAREAELIRIKHERGYAPVEDRWKEIAEEIE